MTRVTFYLLKSQDAQQRFSVAARLAAKAFGQGHRVYLHAPDENTARSLDELLWTFRPSGFIPHALAGEPGAEQIAVGWGDDPGQHDDLLINLDFSIPRFFSRFHRVAEVVSRDEASASALRDSYRFYRDRGYPLDTHEL